MEANNRFLSGNGLIYLFATFVGFAAGIIWSGEIRECWLPSNPRESALVHFQMAKQAFFEHDRSKAIEEAKRVIAMKPKYKEAHKLLAACYGCVGYSEGAGDSFHVACKLDPNGDRL